MIDLDEYASGALKALGYALSLMNRHTCPKRILAELNAAMNRLKQGDESALEP